MSQETMTADQFRRECLQGGDAKKQVSKAVKESERTKLQRAFRVAWECIANEAKLPIPKEEFRFHPVRRWRFDFAFVEHKLSVELHGGQWVNGRHNRGSGVASDHEKFNQAQAAGWVVLQYGTDRMKDPYKVAAEVAEVLRDRITKGKSNV